MSESAPATASSTGQSCRRAKPWSSASCRRGGGAPAASVDLLRDRRGLKVAPSDLADFTQALRSAFGILGERYYLGLRGEPQVRIARDSVVVTFDIEKEM